MHPLPVRGDPFIDGNGRVGRLLITLLLAEWGLLPEPLLDLSAYVEPRRDEYYRRLLAVSTHVDWLGWLTFFLSAVEHQAADVVDRAQRLQALREEYRARVATARSSRLLGLLVDALFETPAITTVRAAQLLNVTYRAARLNIDKLIDADVLRDVTSGRVRVFLATKVVPAIDGVALTPPVQPRRRVCPGTNHYEIELG